jgi:hypothetical protein
MLLGDRAPHGGEVFVHEGYRYAKAIAEILQRWHWGLKEGRRCRSLQICSALDNMGPVPRDELVAQIGLMCSQNGGGRVAKTSAQFGERWRRPFVECVLQGLVDLVGLGFFRQRDLFADCPAKSRILLMDVAVVRVSKVLRRSDEPRSACSI